MLMRLEERQVNDAIYIKGQLAQHGAILRQRNAPRATDSDTAGATMTFRELDAQHLDTFYLSFENRFRGERAAIKEKVRPYLATLAEAEAGASGRPILDVGCGRGEWLELLKENGLEASGLDLNTAMIAQCQERGLSVTHGDVIAHLRSLADATLGAVTGFHIIEHLPLEVLMDLVAETQRVLLPGGIAIFESPNCKNLMVGACNFNVDPTHRNPVFPETAAFIFETQGFADVRLEYLSPVDTTHIPGSAELPSVLQDLLYGPQDFAVIGRKPGPR
jgi:O-antigen chain-terminating methyltransferase